PGGSRRGRSSSCPTHAGKRGPGPAIATGLGHTRSVPGTAPTSAATGALITLVGVLVAGRPALADDLWRRVSRSEAERTYDAAMAEGDRQARRAAELAIEAHQIRIVFDLVGEIQAAALRAAHAYVT